MRNHGDGEGKRKREQRVGSRAVVSKIIEDDGEPRIRSALFRRRASAGCEWSDHVNGVRASSVERVVEAQHAAGGSLDDIKLVAASDLIERSRQSARLRRIGEAHIDVVGGKLACCALERLMLGANGDL